MIKLLRLPVNNLARAAVNLAIMVIGNSLAL